MKETNICADKDRYVVHIWDEMKIKDDLVFDKHTCELIGFINCGDINSHLDDLEQQCNSAENEIRSVASHMLLFMVRGLFLSLATHNSFPPKMLLLMCFIPWFWRPS